MRVLIAGAGIAGPTLAYWLRRAGHEPTLVERAPRLRDGGYLVDFWGAGFEVARRMGIVPRLLERGYRMREMREVSSGGRTIGRLDPFSVIEDAGTSYVTIARADLAAAIYDALDGVGTIFDDDGERVHVEFVHHPPEDFDLVVGADGLHSRVRTLAFGPEQEFERDLGLAVAAFEIPGYRPRDALVAVAHTRVGRQLLRVSLHEDATMFCVVFRPDADVPQDDVPAQQEVLRAALHGMGWEAPAVLEQLPRARAFYMDRTSQIRLPSWSRGRVALVGDAAACPSLLAGQGSALAMVEAYVLAAELHAAHGDHHAAFARYERLLSESVRTKQDAALGLDVAFAPRNRRQALLRLAVLNLMGIPAVAHRIMGRSLRDPIELPAAP